MIKNFYKNYFKNRNLRLIHISRGEEISSLTNFYSEKVYKLMVNNNKPTGLWISFDNLDNSWASFLLHHKDILLSNEDLYIYDVELKKKNKIIYIRNTKDLISFQRKYENPKNHRIYWKDVKIENDGIFMFPSLYNLDKFAKILKVIPPEYDSEDTNSFPKWVLQLDCWSLCVWRTDCIKKFEFREIIKNDEINADKFCKRFKYV